MVVLTSREVNGAECSADFSKNKNMTRYATEGDLVGVSFGLAFIMLVLFFGGFAAIWVGSNKTEVVECQQWKSQAAEYKNFYLLQWQDDQCRAHDIIINAPVK